MNHRTRWIIVCAGVLVAGLAAGSHPARHALGSAPGVKVNVKEYVFTPNTLTVPASTTQLTIANAGLLEHTFVIDALKVKSPRIKPGQTVTFTVALKKGTYQVYCDVPGHQEVGMVATLAVK